MSKQHLEEKILNWLELTDAEKEKVLQHCATCESCKNMLDEAQYYAYQIKEIQQAEFTSGNQAKAVQKIMEEISQTNKEVKANLFFLNRWVLVPFQIAAMVLIVFAWQELFFIEESKSIQLPKHTTASVLNTSALLKSNLKNRKEKQISIREIVEKKIKK